MPTIIDAVLIATFIVLLIALGFFFLPRRRHYLQRCEHYMSRIRPMEYQKLSPYARKGEREQQDQEFWKVSSGLRGLGSRLAISWNCAQIVQAYRDAGYIRKESAREIWIMIACQTLYSLKALPEAVTCHLWGLRHICAQEAVQYYLDLVIQTCTLCVTESAPECVLRLPELL